MKADTEEILRAIHQHSQELKGLIKHDIELILREIKSKSRVLIIVSGQSIHIPNLQQGEDMSYTVARDHQDEPFTLDPITASDSEGPVTIQFTEKLVSSDETVVSVVGTSFHFGTFGGATV